MNGANQTELLRLIVALPLVGAVVQAVLLGLLRRPLPRASALALACGSVGLSFAASFWGLVEVARQPVGERVLVDNLYTWIGAGQFYAEAGFLLDPLSAVMAVVVTGVALLIHVYAIGTTAADTREDKGPDRLFAILNGFVFAMLVLLLADNLVLMFLGWQGVALCASLAIGFWYADDANAAAGARTFVVNRIGDAALLVGILLLFWAFADVDSPSVGFLEMKSAFPALAGRMVSLPGWLHWLPGVPEWRLSTVIGLCLFGGVIAKSAQLPLHVWLPDSTVGPAPASALIHAATMVTAGVYLVCRMSFLYADAPGASAVIAWTGGITASFAATIAVAQSDIKRVLAYSTMSQLGFMLLAAGLGAYSAAIFHAMTQAFIQSLLFLAAGSVVVSLRGESDTDRMGGLWRRLPVTHAAFAVGGLALVGLPYLTAGFFSRDEILLAAYLGTDTPGHAPLHSLALVTAGLTAFYMVRIHVRTFFGDVRVPATQRTQIEESPRVMLVPLGALALLAIVGGYVGPSEAFVPIEGANSLANFLGPVLGESPHETDPATVRRLALLTGVMSLASGVLAVWLYTQRSALPARIRRALGPLSRGVERRFYIDELQHAIVVRPLLWFSDRVLARRIDARMIDGWFVEGAARSVRGAADRVLRRFQTGLVQGYLFAVVLGAVLILAWLLR